MSNKPGKKPGGRTTPSLRTVNAQAQQKILQQNEPRFRAQEAALREQWSDAADDPGFEKFVEVVMSNIRRGVVSHARGGELDNLSMQMQRFERLLTHLMPIGSPERLAFEAAWQETIATSYDNLESALDENDKQMAARNGLLLPAEPRTQSGLVLPGQ